MERSQTTYKIRKRCHGTISQDDKTNSIRHCGIENARVIEQNKNQYTCQLTLSTLRPDPTDENDLVKANRLATQIKAFAASAPILGTNPDDPCEDQSLAKINLQQVPTGPSRYELGDPVLLGTLLPALCDRDVLNSTTGGGGRCPNVPFGENGRATSVASCPAVLVSSKEPIGDVCGTWRRHILNRESWSTQVDEADFASTAKDIVGVSVDEHNDVHVNLDDFRPQLDECGEHFCAAHSSAASPHPLCRCVHRTLVPEYQLMQATSNGPDACWWKPCHDSHAPWALVPARLDPNNLKCPPISCTNIVDMSDIYATSVSIQNLSMYTNCDAQEITQISANHPVDEEGRPDFEARDKERGLDPVSGCPLDVEKLKECAQNFPHIAIEENGDEEAPKKPRCHGKTGIMLKLCDEWHASMFNQFWMVMIAIVAIVFLSGFGAYLWSKASCPLSTTATTASAGTAPVRQETPQ